MRDGVGGPSRARLAAQVLEVDDRRPGGEDPDYVGAAPYLPVEPLLVGIGPKEVWMLRIDSTQSVPMLVARHKERSISRQRTFDPSQRSYRDPTVINGGSEELEMRYHLMTRSLVGTVAIAALIAVP